MEFLQYLWDVSKVIAWLVAIFYVFPLTVGIITYNKRQAAMLRTQRDIRKGKGNGT